MKKRTISKLKSIFSSKKGKRHHQESSKSSRSPSPEPSQEPQTHETFRPILRTPPPPSRPGPPPSPPVPTQPIIPVPPEPTGPQPLLPCPVCCRTFVPQSLSKHVKICEKMAVKKRKTFDSSRQRREGLSASHGVDGGTDLEQFLPKNFGLPENSPFLEKSPPNTAKATPKPKPVSVKTAIAKPSSELQRCPHCNRAFGVRAFERHVEWCADKAKILPAAPTQPPPHIADAKQRLNARTQYKAPPVRGRRSSQTRDKSNNSRSASVESSRGVSPPPPREYGDYTKQGRLRASESMSSNDHDESPHVPVIRNSRNSNTSGDANVKARQARLARDLSSSRFDENYDPFASAARQMKELMSSDTNIAKKFETSCKDPSRTLPIIRPTKEKPTLSYLRTDNTKMIKDSLNKTYQKTPTLQRMKSFGSTNNETNNNSYTFGGRCSSFRLNRNDKKSSQNKLNTTFTKSSTKSSKENILSTTEKSHFNRNSNLNRSFSSYNTTAYSTPKPKDKIPKIATSMYHSFQRTTIKQPIKLDKIERDEKKNFVNLDAILADDNSSMTDSTYIDPRLINENDNLPINVNTILNNPDIISSMESLLTTENLPTKFESFNTSVQNNNIQNNGIKEKEKQNKNIKIETNNNVNGKITAPAIVDDLSVQYDNIMSSLEQSIASKTSIRDDDSLCEDFDLEEFMTSFDEEIHKHNKAKRTCSSTTRVVKPADFLDSNRTSELNSMSSSPKLVHSGSNGLIPVNKSQSLTFSSNNIVSETLFRPSSVIRSSSFLDSIQKKSVTKPDSGKIRLKSDQLEQDIMQSLKEFDSLYDTDRNDVSQMNKEINYNAEYGTAKRQSRVKTERKKNEKKSNGNFTPNGKSADSAYSSLNRISPSKLSVCNSKESNGVTLDNIPAGSDSSGCQKDDLRSMSSDEFLAMERSAELNEPLAPVEIHTSTKEIENPIINEKHVSSRASSRRSSTWRPRPGLSSSGSETSLHRPQRDSAPAPPPRLSRFCHECGSKFPVDTAKFCIECGVKRLLV
ncbi:protein PF14_0175-like isoform X5 [Hyposmocoma kahamanoa]|uniref:protein PF14_0175-like isoform X5 n=1 Tax=Hyposmocoma kahamanoa TaxID=1477025 RepID=UPI000E6D6DB6|nr:protein PF14_0175-like isoform X5 [Hyposmocoma kahamanoa]